MSRVIGVKQSPIDERRWLLALDCGHVATVASSSKLPSRGRPKRRIHACDECIAERQARMADR